MFIKYEEVEGIRLEDISDDDASQLLQQRDRATEAMRQFKNGQITPSQVDKYQLHINVYDKVRKHRDFLATFHECGEAMTMAPFCVTVSVSPFWRMPLMRAELFKRIFDNPPVDGTFLFDIKEL